MAFVVITAPSLRTSENVSGISTLAAVMLQCRQIHFKHLRAGAEDKRSSRLSWLQEQKHLIVRAFALFSSKDCKAVHINTALNPKSVVRDLVLGILARLLRRRLVYHIHGGRYMAEDARGLIYILCRGMIALGHHIVVLSSIEAGKLNVQFGRSDGVVVWMNCVSLGADDILSRPLARHIGVPKILFLGRVHESKGIEDLALALEQMALGVNGFEFILAGEGPLREWLVSRLDRALGERFRYVGIVRDHAKWALLEEASIFVLPSRWGEGVPVALLEAMAAGLAVVCTADGSIASVVEDRHSAVLVRKNAPLELAEVLEGLLRNRKDRVRLGLNARSAVMHGYTSDTYQKCVEKFYQNMFAEERKI